MTDDNAPQIVSDASLLVRYRAGEDDAATALYTRYAEKLIKLAERSSGDDLSARIDAEDIVQSVFRTFFRRVSDGHYQIPDGEELWKLLLVMALNKIRDTAKFHHAVKRDVASTKSIDGQETVSAANPAIVLRMTIDELLASIPESHRTVVRDRIDGLEIAEIAERGVVSRRSVERILRSFRVRLSKLLDNQ